MIDPPKSVYININTEDDRIRGPSRISTAKLQNLFKKLTDWI